MRMKKTYLWIVIVALIVGVILILNLSKNTTKLDVNSQHLSFDEFIAYHSEAEGMNEREKDEFKQDVKQQIDEYDISENDAFMIIEFTPKKSDDVLEKIILSVCMNSDGKVFPINRENFYFKDHATNKHYYQCLFNMTFDFSVAYQIKYDIEGQVVNYRSAGGTAKYEDDILVSERVNRSVALEKDDILLTFKETGTVVIATTGIS